MKILDTWNLEQIYYDLALQELPTCDAKVALPAAFIRDAAVHPLFVDLHGEDEQERFIIAAQTVVDRHAYAKRRYHTDQNTPDTMQVGLLSWQNFVYLLCRKEGIEVEAVRAHPTPKPPAPLDMTPVSVNSIRRHLADDGFRVLGRIFTDEFKRAMNRGSMAKHVFRVAYDVEPRSRPGCLFNEDDLRRAGNALRDEKYDDDDMLLWTASITKMRGAWMPENVHEAPSNFCGSYFMVSGIDSSDNGVWCNGTIIQGDRWLGTNGISFVYAFGTEKAAEHKNGHVFPDDFPYLTCLGRQWRPWWTAIAEKINGGQAVLQKPQGVRHDPPAPLFIRARYNVNKEFWNPGGTVKEKSDG